MKKTIISIFLLSLTTMLSAQVNDTVQGHQFNQQTPINSSRGGGPLTSAVVLYDNGPLVNSPGTGVGGLDESVLQNTSLGLNIFGFGHHASTDNRIADDFVVPTGGWDIGQIEFFAYQTNETASTITTVHVRIWDGVPGQVGSNVIFGDMSTNRMIQTAPTYILRVNENTTGSATDRQIAVSLVDINTTLSAGIYWLEWQVDGSGGSGPWAPPITITGNDTTGNGMQSSDGGISYNAALDSGTNTQQGFPFIIYGASPTATQVPALTLIGLITLLFLIVLVSRRYKGFI